EPLEDFPAFMSLFNKNLPQDILATSIREVDNLFNIIQNPKLKEYLYLFSFGEKNHPFCAPLMATIQDDLDIDLMKAGAKLFEGSRNFKNYCVAPSENTVFERIIIKSEITENQVYTANFFPKTSYVFRVQGAGFLRNQIRLMMGALIQLGKGELELTDIEKSLQPENTQLINYIAPASGLILNRIDFE
ncbi:MAG TPA: tRNA pseudouridine(38-40) synthase TruA, partial [Gillisia sp.]|nr:tRNA pseudouridine(38-40) synthase TruA [Gillisia sp.]